MEPHPKPEDGWALCRCPRFVSAVEEVEGVAGSGGRAACHKEEQGFILLLLVLGSSGLTSPQRRRSSAAGKWSLAAGLGDPINQADLTDSDPDEGHYTSSSYTGYLGPV